VGLGLIGASVAAAARKAGLYGTILGIEPRDDHRGTVELRSWVDDATDDLSKASHADLVVVAVPSHLTGPTVQRVLETCAQAIVTDTASVKGPVMAAVSGLEGRRRFVASHPMAGKASSGPADAEADLFAGQPVLVCQGDAPAQALHQVETFWQALGASTMTCPADRHDMWVAAVSHAPHVLAFALAATAAHHVGPGITHVAGPSFQDMTRVAASDPAFWQELLLANADKTLDALESLTQRLERFKVSLSNNDADALRDLLEQGHMARAAFEKGKASL
jgi:prephenate dehydrogenase